MERHIEKEVERQFNQIKYGRVKCVEIISEGELKKKIARSIDPSTLRVKPHHELIVKAGFDPSAPDLHLGHVVLLRKLLDFLELGHKVTFLIGDFTALIGDPSGQKKTRPMMTRPQVEANTKTYLQQVHKVFDAEAGSFKWRDDEANLDHQKKNSDWFDQFTLEQTLKRLTSQYTVAQLLERDDFAKRFKEKKPITVSELLYPLMQGYDSVYLHADVEIGGTDQKFNLLVGRELQQADTEKTQKKYDPQVVITLPLLEGLDGVQKMSKSLGNAITIQEDSKEMFGKLMSISDKLMLSYYELLTGVRGENIEQMKDDLKNGKVHPKKLKEDLAFIITKKYHGSEKANEALEGFRRVFQKREIPEEIPTVSLRLDPDGKVDLPKLLVEAKLAASTSQARRLIQQGAVKKNRSVKIKDYRISLQPRDVLQVGPRKFVKIEPKKA